MLGFKIDPEDRLGDILKQLLAYYETYYKKPQLGVEYVLESGTAATGEETKGSFFQLPVLNSVVNRIVVNKLVWVSIRLFVAAER